MKGVKAKIYVNAGTKPIFCKARPVPYASTDKVEKELEQAVSNETDFCYSLRLGSQSALNSER